ncbi:MAG: CpXC domain-containing protein [Chloroflexota bacterium]
MPVSYAENAALDCPACGAHFDAEVWNLVDAAERPDLVELLRAGELNVVVCPQCGHRGPAGAPLLLHDPEARRVYFAAPAGAAEHQVREMAQGLLYLLVGSLPEEARLPYLGDLQVEQELEGVRRAIERRSRRPPARERSAPAVATASPASIPAPVAPSPPADPSPILDAVQILLAADSAEEIERVVAEHPALLDPAADEVLASLIDIAHGQGERDVAHALSEARQTLRDLRAGPGEEPQAAAGGQMAPSVPSPAQGLTDDAYQALMQAQSPAELADVVRDHVVLLEEWADDELSWRAEQALDEGNERLAHAIEARRDALAELRAELTGEAAVAGALEELLRAGEDEEALAAALSTHPVLLTDVAQEALFRFAAESRARGDDALAERAVEYRAMLRKVREGLEESS